jgi:prepilin-type N-terminal cleavage/methylation domain-containing protein
MKIKSNRKAFTLIELIVVIVVLGIVLSIVAEIIAKMYGGYITARTSERLQSKTELAAQQIANRLSYRIPPTVIAKDAAGNAVALHSSDGTRQRLEWIGRDFVSFRGAWNGAMHVPLWSGFIDLDNPATNSKQIVTTATRPASLSNSINTQSFGTVSLTGPNRPAIIFRGKKDDYDFMRYYANATGVNDATLHYAYPVQCNGACNDANPVLEFVNNYGDGVGGTEDIILYEQYDLAWSAYALVPIGDELRLYYGYQPWEGDVLNVNTTQFSVLLDDLQTFQFMQVGEVIRIKVCATENDGGGFANDDGNLTVCKEKAIL